MDSPVAIVIMTPAFKSSSIAGAPALLALLLTNLLPLTGPVRVSRAV
ncbi:MAG TPA: hypothetical protein VN730_02775 [Steroidobacteraceae bacterium]|nr:hypothetical protein [Steroidobacteraceae bacterium]